MEQPTEYTQDFKKRKIYELDEQDISLLNELLSNNTDKTMLVILNEQVKNCIPKFNI